MAHQWYVRNYAMGNTKYVAELSEVDPLANSQHYTKDEQAKALEKVLNRELPDGKVRNRKAKRI